MLSARKYRKRKSSHSLKRSQIELERLVSLQKEERKEAENLAVKNYIAELKRKKLKFKN
jgi:hypothetical protein